MATSEQQVEEEFKNEAEIEPEGASADSPSAEAEWDSPTAAVDTAPVAPAPAAAPAPAQQDNTPKSSDLFMLARQQNFSVASKLLSAYPQLWAARDEDGHSLLHWAALVGNNEFVTAALANGIAVDSLATNLQSPLMWAVLRGHTTTARLLLEKGADSRLKDSLGATAMIIAIQHACYTCMLLMLQRGDKAGLLGDCDKNGCYAVHWAAYKGDLTALKLAEYFGADLLAFDNQKMLPLHRAVFGSQGQVVEFLMERNADPMLRNNDGKSCIDIAESQGDLGMQALFKRLMKKGKDKGGSNAVADESGMGLMSGEEGAKGKKSLKHHIAGAFKDKQMHIVFPVFWLVCVSLALFEYIMDLRATSYAVAPRASMFFEFGVPFTLAIFAYTALMDPGKVPAKTRGNSGVEEIMKAIDCPDEVIVDLSRLCTTTWVLKGLRSKYCTQTGAVVDEFDHYCIWLNCAIGKNNHRPFIILAISECLTQLSHIFLIFYMVRELVTVQGTGAWLFAVFTGYPLLALLMIGHCFTAPWVFMLFLHQSRLVAMNLTTNEMLNAGRYDHFWTVVEVMPGRSQKVYRNPFNKGGVWRNALDFWWYRNRQRFGPLEVINAATQKPCCSKSGCSKHSHGAGGHGHGHGHDAV